MRGSAAGSRSSSRSAAIGSGRTPPCSSRRRATSARAGSSTSARGSARSGSALAKRNPLASVDLVEIDPETARLAERNAARNGLQARTRVLRLDALNPKERREAGLAESADCVVTNPPFFDAGRSAPLPTRAKRARISWREAGAGRLDLSLARDARAPGPFRDDPPSRRARRDPRGDRRPARRARASAGSSDARRERASPARLGREGLEGPACASRRGSSCTGPTAGSRRRRTPSIAASGSSTGAAANGRAPRIPRAVDVYSFARDAVFSVA